MENLEIGHIAQQSVKRGHEKIKTLLFEFETQFSHLYTLRLYRNAGSQLLVGNVHEIAQVWRFAPLRVTAVDGKILIGLVIHPDGVRNRLQIFLKTLLWIVGPQAIVVQSSSIAIGPSWAIWHDAAWRSESGIDGKILVPQAPVQVQLVADVPVVSEEKSGLIDAGIGGIKTTGTDVGQTCWVGQVKFLPPEIGVTDGHCFWAILHCSKTLGSWNEVFAGCLR